MATHPSILAWRIPQTEEPRRLWSMDQGVISAGEDRDISLGPKPPKELPNKLCHDCGHQEPLAPWIVSDPGVWLGEGSGVLEGSGPNRGPSTS